MRLTMLMPNSNNVVAGGTATWDFPIGRRYHQLFAEFSGVTLAQMTEIRVIVNGEVIHRYSAVQRDAMNQYDGRAAAGAILCIPFDRFGLYSQGGEEKTALQTGIADPKTGKSITNFRLEIDIDAAASAPVITLTALQSANVGGSLVIRRVIPFTNTYTASGEQELADLPKATQGPAYQIVNRVFFKTANTTKLSILVDNVEIFKRSKALNDRIATDGVRVPQSGYFVFDPVEEGYDWEALMLVNGSGAPVQDFRYRFTLSAAETVLSLVEYIGAL